VALPWPNRPLPPRTAQGVVALRSGTEGLCGYGTQHHLNGGADSATVGPATTALVSYDTSTRSQAANRDHGVPLYGALLADRPFLAEESGFAGQPSDGLAQLDASHRLTRAYGDALNGNVVQTALDAGPLRRLHRAADRR
jgi:glucoamylase